MGCDIAFSRFLLPLLLLPLVAAETAWTESNKDDYTWKQANFVPSRRIQDISCYTQLKGHFIGQTVRLSLASADSDKACIIQLPTNTDIAFTDIEFSSPQTFTRVLVGDDKYRLSGGYGKIFKYASKDLYGDYSTPCLNAFLVVQNSGIEDSVTFTIKPMAAGSYESSEYLCNNEFHFKNIKRSTS